jgi:MHS family proline/betaine transporter-like MFS transporter
MLQGLSMGGALTGSVSFLIEHTSKKNRGIAGSVPMASICLGILLGSIVSHTVRACMSEENFVSWGWRIPFFFGIFIMFAGFYIRKYTQETPLFQEIKSRDQILKSPLKTAVKNHWFDIIVSILINATGSVIFYMQAIYIMNYLAVERGVPSREISYMVNVSYIVMIFVTIFAGWLSDIVGRRKIFVFNLIAIACSSFFLMDIFAHGDITSIWYAQIIFAIFAGTYIGPEPALQAELFPTNVRNTALSLAYNIGTSLFGGTTPYVLYLLLYKTGGINASAYYIITCTILSMVALYFYKDRSV